jgi:hypothetical protein
MLVDFFSSGRRAIREQIDTGACHSRDHRHRRECSQRRCIVEFQYRRADVMGGISKHHSPKKTNPTAYLVFSTSLCHWSTEREETGHLSGFRKKFISPTRVCSSHLYADRIRELTSVGTDFEQFAVGAQPLDHSRSCTVSLRARFPLLSTQVLKKFISSRPRLIRSSLLLTNLTSLYVTHCPKRPSRAIQHIKSSMAE